MQYPAEIAARVKRASHPSRATLATLVCASAAVLLLGACTKSAPDENVRPEPRGGSGGRGGTGPEPLDGGGMGPTGGRGERDGGVAGSDGPIIGGSGGSGGSGGTGPTDAGPQQPPPFTKRALLETIADCALVHYRDFEEHARALAEATQAHADDPTADRADAARDAWRAAMASFERVELFRFGPLARTTDPGGQNLRDEIYAFPLSNSCQIDRQIVDQTYADSSFPSTLSSARGLSAIEYLLFYTGASNACSSAIDINADGTWAALSAQELAQRRADYAAAAAADVRARAAALVAAWDPDDGDFHGQLAKAGAGSSVYDMDQDALNAVSDGIFYIEAEVKDLKLGWPLGLVPDCVNSPDPCPDAVESRYARVSTDHLRQNLAAFRKLFQGCAAGYSGLGFDDWLDAVGAEDLRERMLEALIAAQEAVDTLDPPLEEALVSDIAKVSAVHAAVKAVTDLLKTEFITVLNLELPEGAVGDND